MKKNSKGFTLIELVLVVAILAIIAVVAVGKFGDLRKAAARKTNLSSIANIHRAIDTKIAMTDKRTGRRIRVAASGNGVSMPSVAAVAAV